MGSCESSSGEAQEQVEKCESAQVLDLLGTWEYGGEGALKLLQWRRASHWTNFVNKMISMMREQRDTRRMQLSWSGLSTIAGPPGESTKL